LNPPARPPRVNPWIVVALAAALALLVMTTLTLIVEPGIMHTIHSALQGLRHMVDECPPSGAHCP
jgi:hypothetical protein